LRAAGLSYRLHLKKPGAIRAFFRSTAQELVTFQRKASSKICVLIIRFRARHHNPKTLATFAEYQMHIEEALKNQHLLLTPTTKWIRVDDPRPAFQQAFPKMRFGKLVGSRFYVTLPAIVERFENLISQSGYCLVYLPSTDGSGRRYPGVDTAGIPEGILEDLIHALRMAVDENLAT
jgi:hypothetical protein